MKDDVCNEKVNKFYWTIILSATLQLLSKTPENLIQENNKIYPELYKKYILTNIFVNLFHSTNIILYISSCILNYTFPNGWKPQKFTKTECVFYLFETCKVSVTDNVRPCED